ncbi:MAG: endonuclease/exonuclease/phosphatase family protein [Pseudomonadota bacterium]
MLRDLQRGKDPQSTAVVNLLAWTEADVLVLLDIDWDLGGRGLDALVQRLAEAGQEYPYRVNLRPNAGRPSGHDLDSNGHLGDARDALGYGRFMGDGGLAVLSKHPVGPAADHSGVLWRDMPDGAARDLYPPAILDNLPVATVAQWAVPITVGNTTITLIPLAAGPPVFDGPEDRNGLRNRDELRFAARLVDDVPHPIVIGRANLDPDKGEGHPDALRALLDHGALQDTRPEWQDRGQARMDTVNWQGPGPMRVDYLLADRGLGVRASGVLWPSADDTLFKSVEAAGPSRVVWADLTLP